MAIFHLPNYWASTVLSLNIWGEGGPLTAFLVDLFVTMIRSPCYHVVSLKRVDEVILKTEILCYLQGSSLTEILFQMWECVLGASHMSFTFGSHVTTCEPNVNHMLCVYTCDESVITCEILHVWFFWFRACWLKWGVLHLSGVLRAKSRV